MLRSSNARLRQLANDLAAVGAQMVVTMHDEATITAPDARMPEALQIWTAYQIETIMRNVPSPLAIEALADLEWPGEAP